MNFFGKRKCSAIFGAKYIVKALKKKLLWKLRVAVAILLLVPNKQSFTVFRVFNEVNYF